MAENALAIFKCVLLAAHCTADESNHSSAGRYIHTTVPHVSYKLHCAV